MNKIPHDWERAVDRFADAMKSKLALHAAKGDWRHTPTHKIFEKLREEVVELEISLSPPVNAVEVLLEAADVALCAMMIADNKMGNPRPKELKERTEADTLCVEGR